MMFDTFIVYTRIKGAEGSEVHGWSGPHDARDLEWKLPSMAEHEAKGSIRDVRVITLEEMHLAAKAPKER